MILSKANVQFHVRETPGKAVQPYKSTFLNKTRSLCSFGVIKSLFECILVIIFFVLFFFYSLLEVVKQFFNFGYISEFIVL